MAKAVIVCLVTAAVTTQADASQTIRLWPAAAVVADEIRLADLCEIEGFTYDEHERVANLVIAEAPPPGGSKIITLDDLRTRLAGLGVNMALTVIKGSVECGVTRPQTRLEITGPEVQATDGENPGSDKTHPQTLRDAVQQHFDAELERFGGRVELSFSQTAAQVLELSGPQYSFGVRRRSAKPIGMVDLEVTVRREGEPDRKLDLLVHVVFLRTVVVAKMGINRLAEIRPDDVRTTEMRMDRLDKVGLSEPDRVIGQRAKRYMPAGSMIVLRDLESVPLVQRGQLVTVESSVGGTVIRTVAKAIETGSLGDTVELRSGNANRRQICGTVSGPRRVTLVSQPADTAEEQGLAFSGKERE